MAEPRAVEARALAGLVGRDFWPHSQRAFALQCQVPSRLSNNLDFSRRSKHSKHSKHSNRSKRGISFRDSIQHPSRPVSCLSLGPDPPLLARSQKQQRGICQTKHPVVKPSIKVSGHFLWGPEVIWNIELKNLCSFRFGCRLCFCYESESWWDPDHDAPAHGCMGSFSPRRGDGGLVHALRQGLGAAVCATPPNHSQPLPQSGSSCSRSIKNSPERV